MIEAPKNRLIASMTRRATLALAGALACSTVLAGLAPIPAADPIKVGHYGSMTGSEATFGQSTDRGIRLAVEEINAAGGINGRPIELITYDTKGDSGEAGKAGANDQGMGAVLVIHGAMDVLREASIVVRKPNGGLILGTLRRLR